MNLRGTRLAAALAFVAVFILVLAWPRGEPKPSTAASTNASKAPASKSAAGGKLSSEAVLSVAPGAGATPASGSAPSISPLMVEFAKRREYKPIYDELKAKAERNGEESYVLAEILDNCATVTDRTPPRRSGWKLGGDEARARFVAALGEGDAALREKRLAAFDKMNVDPCAGFESVSSTQKEIMDLLQQSAAAGDPKGKAMLLYRELQLDTRVVHGDLVEISDAQVETIKQVLASKDPRALVDVANVFAYHLANLSLRAGPERTPVDYSAFHGAATLAACELGYPCGPDSRTLLAACALQGMCDAANYRDYLFFYYLSPSTSQLTAEYHQNLMRGIQQGDWSYFTFHRGPAPTYAPFQRR